MAKEWKQILGYDENQAISGKICNEHFERDNLRFASQRFWLKTGSKPSIFIRNDSVSRIFEADSVNTISVCSSECGKIELLRQIKELRECMNRKATEHEQEKQELQFKVQNLSSKNDELRKKLATIRSRAQYLENTKIKLNSTVQKLQEDKVLTDKFSKGLQVKKILVFHLKFNKILQFLILYSIYFSNCDLFRRAKWAPKTPLYFLRF